MRTSVRGRAASSRRPASSKARSGAEQPPERAGRRWLWTRSAAQLTRECGAYALLLMLDRSVALPRRFDRRRLPRGCYCYVGSAHGAGGIRGRCARHLRAPLTRHWHIDWLLAGALDRVIVALPGQRECTVLTRLLAIEGASVPVSGFGSTDCRRCPSHLLALDAASLAALPDRLVLG